MGFWSKIFGGGGDALEAGKPVPDFPASFHDAQLAAITHYLDGKPFSTPKPGPRDPELEAILTDTQRHLPELAKEAHDRGLLRAATPREALNGLKVTELKPLLKSHGLRVSGKKAVLIARIVESVPLADYAAAVRPMNVITDFGREVVAKWEALAAYGCNLGEDMYRDITTAAKRADRTLAHDDIGYVMREMFQRQCDSLWGTGNWLTLSNAYQHLAYHCGRDDVPGRNAMEAARASIYSIAISLSGMRQNNGVEWKSNVMIGLNQTRELHSDGLSDDVLVAEAKKISREVVRAVPFSYFSAEDMAAIIEDEIREGLPSMFISEIKKYSKMWKRPSTRAKNYTYVSENFGLK